MKDYFASVRPSPPAILLSPSRLPPCRSPLGTPVIRPNLGGREKSCRHRAIVQYRRMEWSP